MPTIQPYIPKQLPSPLVGVASRSSKGEAERQVSQEADQTERDLERERGSQLESMEQERGAELKGAADVRGTALQGAADIRGAQEKGLSEIAGGVVKAVGNTLAYQIEKRGNQARYQQQYAQQAAAAAQNSLTQKLSEAAINDFATDQANTAQQHIQQVQQSDAYRTDPVGAMQAAEKTILHGSVAADGYTPAYTNAKGEDASVDAGIIRAEEYDETPTSNTALYKLQAEKAGKTAVDGPIKAGYQKAYDLATKNAENSSEVQRNNMVQQIGGINEPTLQARIEKTQGYQQTVVNQIEANRKNVLGDIRADQEIQKVKYAAGDALLHNLTTLIPSQPLAQIAHAAKVINFIQTGELDFKPKPSIPPAVAGMLKPKLDPAVVDAVLQSALPKIQVTPDAKEKALDKLYALHGRATKNAHYDMEDAEAREEAQANDLKNQSLDTVQGSTAAELHAAVSKEAPPGYRDPMVLQKITDIATARIQTLKAKDSTVDTIPGLTPELRVEMHSMLQRSMDRYRPVLDAANSVNASRMVAERAAAKEAGKAKADAMGKTMEGHIEELRRLADDDSLADKRMPALRKETQAMMRDAIEGNNNGSLTNTQYQKYLNYAAKVSADAATYQIAADQLWQILPAENNALGGVFSKNSPEYLQGEEAKKAKAKATYQLYSDIHSLRTDMQRENFGKQIQGLSQPESDMVSKADAAAAKKLGIAVGQLPNATHQAIVNYVVGLRGATKAATAKPVAGKHAPGLIVPPPPKIPAGQPSTLAEDPAITSLKAQVEELTRLVKAKQGGAE